MRIPRTSLPIAAVAIVVALTGCSTSTQPDPSPSASPASAEPTTLEELATALVDEGVVVSATLSVVEALDPDPERLAIRIQGLEESTPQELAAMLGVVQERIDGVLDDRPASTQIQLSSLRADASYASVDMQTDLGRDVLVELLAIATETPCSDVATYDTDRLGYADGDEELTSFTTTVASLECLVDVDGAAALAATYDEITAIVPTSPLIDETRWRVEPIGAESGDAELRIDAGPIEGRQQLYVDLLTAAEEAGGERLYVEDYGFRVDVGGDLGADQAPVCDVLFERLRAVPDLRTRTVALTDPATPDDYSGLCFLQE